MRGSASSPTTPGAQCESLKPTLERKHALQAARRIRARDKSVSAYRCDACGGWHVGTSSGLKKRTKTLNPIHQIRS